jgi:hypothetical protein
MPSGERATLTINAAGQCTIAADQAGTAGVSAASQVTQSFVITAPQRQQRRPQAQPPVPVAVL